MNTVINVECTESLNIVMLNYYNSKYFKLSTVTFNDTEITVCHINTIQYIITNKLVLFQQ